MERKLMRRVALLGFVSLVFVLCFIWPRASEKDWEDMPVYFMTWVVPPVVSMRARKSGRKKPIREMRLRVPMPVRKRDKDAA